MMLLARVNDLVPDQCYTKMFLGESEIKRFKSDLLQNPTHMFNQ